MILLILVFLSTLITLQASESEPLTMSAAVALAMKHNPDLGALRYAIQADRSAAKSAKCGYMPTIDATSNLSREQGVSNISTQTVLSANQLIYAGSGPRQQYQKAKATVACTELEKAVMANNIRKETEKAFLNAWLAQEQAALMRVSKAAAKNVFKEQKHEYTLKKIDREIWLKNASEYADTIAQADEYYDDKHMVYSTLSFLMGESVDLINDNKKIAWHYKKKVRPLKPLETYLNLAMAKRPEVPRGLKRIAVEKWNTKILQGTRLPTITLSAQSECDTQPASDPFVFSANAVPEVIDTANNPNKPATGITAIWSINLGIKWSFFDGLVTHYQEQQAQALKMKEMLAHEKQLLAIKHEVQAAYYSYSKTHRQLKAQKLHLLWAANDYKLQQQKLKLGKITEAACASAQAAWYKTRFDWLASRVQVAMADCDLQHACGYSPIS